MQKNLIISLITGQLVALLPLWDWGDMNMWIKSITKPGDLDQIKWGIEIPEEFQNEVLKDYMKILTSGGVA